MTITWYGQACFRLESKDIRILIDPFDKETGFKPSRINDAIVLVTHDHHDHNNLAGTGPETFIVKGPGEYEKAGVQIIGISSFHDNEQGSQRGRNTIYVLKIEDITICHLGDFGQDELASEQIEMIGSVDILMIPVGGCYTIDGKQAADIVKQIEPKIIIPMHFKTAGINPATKLSGPEVFLKEVGIKPEEVEQFKISAKTLPQEEIKLVTFKL